MYNTKVYTLLQRKVAPSSISSIYHIVDKYINETSRTTYIIGA